MRHSKGETDFVRHCISIFFRMASFSAPTFSLVGTFLCRRSLLVVSFLLVVTFLLACTPYAPASAGEPGPKCGPQALNLSHYGVGAECQLKPQAQNVNLLSLRQSDLSNYDVGYRVRGHERQHIPW